MGVIRFDTYRSIKGLYVFLFLKKKKQKNIDLFAEQAASHPITAYRSKVFWFFFPKKNGAGPLIQYEGTLEPTTHSNPVKMLTEQHIRAPDSGKDR